MRPATGARSPARPARPVIYGLPDGATRAPWSNFIHPQIRPTSPGTARNTVTLVADGEWIVLRSWSSWRPASASRLGHALRPEAGRRTGPEQPGAYPAVPGQAARRAAVLHAPARRPEAPGLRPAVIDGTVQPQVPARVDQAELTAPRPGP
jgi:hypothetical protein